MRYIGIDLHKTNFVVCFLATDETTRTETYPLTKPGIARFIAQLEPKDEVAVEVTANIYYFYDRLRLHVSRVVLVDTYRFAVIAKSKKKTDKADAAALARFLKLDYLPTVPVPSERVRQLRHLLQARETLVGLRTKLKNMGHGALTRNGIALSRSAFASRLSRVRLEKRDDLAPAAYSHSASGATADRGTGQRGRDVRGRDRERRQGAGGRAAALADTRPEPFIGYRVVSRDRRH
jgi:transposase